MATDLRNTFCWSFSQAKDFADCRRRHYLNRYGFWEGWDSAAPIEARTAYRLKQMKNKWALIGDAVDSVIAEALKRRDVSVPFSVKDAIERANQFFRKAWKQHHSNGWRSDPKNIICIRELYYKELPAEAGIERDAWVDSVKQRTVICLENFFDNVLPRLPEVRHGDLLPIARAGDGDPEHFHLGQVKVYAIPDWAYRHDGRVKIHDWKTGVRRESHLRQMSIYGLWAQMKRQAPVDAIDLMIEYLEAGEMRPVPYDTAVASEICAQINASVMEMRKYLVSGDLERNEPKPIEEFPKTDDLRKCRHCNFRELCNRVYALTAPDEDEDEA
ncbi:PD-(D/E)XK nuclease family protein [bacterium]|nr:PD-(D/E)XK nuclease family protein [bacterium]